MKPIRLLLILLLAAASVFMGYKLMRTIQEPIEFEQLSQERRDNTIQRLKDIRTVQLAHKARSGRYTGSFDTLINFAKTDSIMLEKIIGDPNDSTVQVIRDTTYIAIMDTIFKGERGRVDSMRYIPHGKGSTFSLAATTIEKNEIEIPAFEASAPYTTVYNGLIKKFYKDRWFDSMTVGSLTDGTTNGNWKEK